MALHAPWLHLETLTKNQKFRFVGPGTVFTKSELKRYLDPQTENFDFLSKSPNASRVHVGPQNGFY